MKIYVDYDDCLCETARSFSRLAVEMFGKHVPYEKIRYFDLDKSFDLDDDQFQRFMIKGHDPEVLLSYEETPGASATINELISQGHEVSIITGRPFSAYEPSREWLDKHGLKDVRLYCLNKYGRDTSFYNTDFSLELEDYYKMKFDFAVEDSPKAFKFFDRLPDRGGRLEIHIGNPQGQQVIPAENRLEIVGHNGAGATSVHYFVEIV